MSSTPGDQTDAFQVFLSSMDERLSAFIDHGLPETVAVGEEERTFVKDLSPASLPWIEAYAVSRLPSPALASAPANQRLSEDLMRYVGETFLRTLGGSWRHDPDGSDHGMPYVEVPTSETADGPDPTNGSEATDDTDDETPPEAVVTVDVSVLSLLMTALQQRTGDVFVSALLGIAGVGSEEESGAAPAAADPEAEGSGAPADSGGRPDR